jgi:PiT family inorganic phosphate transporter
MGAAWLITLPAAAVVGAIMWWIGHLLGGLFGALAIFVILCLMAGWMWQRSRKAPVDHSNVNDAWTAPASAATSAATRAATRAAVG